MDQHLLRHITRIQVQNFTPFPARDAFASALTQPSEQSQFTQYGNLSDDLDVALARKRSRRMSSSSVVTVKSQGFEDHTNEESRAIGSALFAEQRVRKRTISRVSTRELSTSAGSGSHPPLSGSGISSKINRPRTHSVASSTSGKGTVPTITLWQSYTQRTLEKVLQSRLVETLITIDVPGSLEQPGPPEKPPTPSRSPSSRDRRPSPRASPLLKSKSHSTQNSPSRSILNSREDQLTKRVSKTGTAKSTDSSAPTPTSPNRRGVTGPTKFNGNAPKLAPPPSQVNADPEVVSIPNFISTIHRPSTNPDFALDIHDFCKWTDPSATHIAVQLWAKLHPDRPNVLGTDKGKGKISDDVDSPDPHWKVAGKWDICLTDLVPFPDEVSVLQF
jgi:hypothetical protein